MLLLARAARPFAGQSSGEDNGIYEMTSPGSSSSESPSAAVSTRTADGDSSSELQFAAVFVDEGSEANIAFVQTSDSIAVNSTALVWVQFSSTTIVAGNG